MSNSKQSKMALLVVGFDGYNDLWDDYFKLLNKYWKDREYPTYLSNNELKSEYENVTVINCGKDAEWSRKVQTAIDLIEEDYICLLLEDFYTGTYVDGMLVDNVIDFIKQNDLKYYKINTFSKIKSPRYNNIKHLRTIPANLPYGISLQPAIWNKEFLKEKLGKENYNAWIFEYDRIKESSNNVYDSLEGCVYDDRNILQIKHGVVQGKYLPPIVKYFEKINQPLDISGRKVMPTREYFLYRIKNITKSIVPLKLINPMKKILGKFGMSFVSDKYMSS